METTSGQSSDPSSKAGAEAACGDDDPGDVYSAVCPCREVLDLVGSKWSVLVIGRLEEEPHRFGQLRRAVPGITPKMLTQTLRRLEQDGLVDRRVLAEMRPPQVEYSLTGLGLSITEPLAAIRLWSERHLPDVRSARRRFEEGAPAATGVG